VAEQKRGIRGAPAFFYRLFIAFWVVASSLVYCIAVMVIAPVATKTAKQIARLWMIHLLFFSRVKVKTTGIEKLDKKGHYVFIVNHQSYFDIPVLSAGLPFFLSFIAKKELFMIPIFGWAMAAAGHIWIDRENARKARKSITRAISKLGREHISLVLFPEGTRSQSDTMGVFKRASFTLAIESGVSVVPVSIIGNRNILAKRSLNLQPGTVRVIIGDPISQTVIAGLDKNALSALVREKMIEGIGAGLAIVAENG
jgi:1-acyl-sn-glycerol-3-phosphate acyltransferase